MRGDRGYPMRAIQNDQSPPECRLVPQIGKVGKRIDGDLQLKVPATFTQSWGRIAKHHSRTTVRVNEVCAHAADTRFSHVIERSVSNIRADYYNSAEMGAVAVQRIEQRTVVERIYARLHEHCARQSQHPRELSIAHKIANSRCVLAVGRERIRDGSP